MSFLDALMLGFSVSLSWENLYVCLIGVTLGTAVGVLPGDKVLYAKDAGYEVRLAGSAVRVMRRCELIARVHD